MNKNRYMEIATSDLPFDDRHRIILRHVAEMAEGFASEARKYIDQKDVLNSYWLGKAQGLLEDALSDLNEMQED
jgi:hypothetical protein